MSRPVNLPIHMETASPEARMIPLHPHVGEHPRSVDQWLVAQAGHPVGGEGNGGGAHGEGAAKYQMPGETPNIISLVEAAFSHGKAAHAGERPEPESVLHLGPVPIPVNSLFSIFYAILIVWVIRKALRNASIERPGKLQNAVEMILGGLRNFFLDILGKENERYVPFVGTLWLFILVNNLAGIVPGLKAPSSSIKFTFGLGICTFCYVHYNALRENGFKGYLFHLLGSPTDMVTWVLCPLFFFLEVLGELIKPISLSLRLFGNIFGEDKLLAIFLGLGMMIVAGIFGTAHPIVGLPLQVIFYPLVILTSTIQATVFSLLAAIYIVLLLPHKHDHEHAPATGPEMDEPSSSLAAAGQV